MEPAQFHIHLLNTTVGHCFCSYVERIGKHCLFATGLDVDSEAHPLSANDARHVLDVRPGASPV